MRLDLEDIGEIVELIQSLKPAAGSIVSAIQSYGPEVKSLLNGIVDGGCDLTVRAYRNYMEAGFSHEEALLLTVDLKLGMKEIMDKVKGKEQ